MTKVTASILTTGWLIFSSACAQHASNEVEDQQAGFAQSTGRISADVPFSSGVRQGTCEANWQPDSILVAQADEMANARFESSDYSIGQAGSNLRTLGSRTRVDARFRDIAASYDFGASGRSVFDSLGLVGEPALGFPFTYVRRYGMDKLGALLGDQGQNPSNSSSSGLFTVGYAWRNLKLERAAFSIYANDESKLIKQVLPKFGSRSTRLSFNLAPNWAFQISRGTVSNLDQLVPNGDIRRTAISATYNRAFSEGTWQTTLAWGRNSRKFRENTFGYLAESTLKFGGAHAMFGRVEQVNSDELIRQNELLQRHLFKMNKLTLGYFQEVRPSGSFGFDIGALVSRHFIPSNMTPSYGKDPTAYMMFIRLKLQ